jgi:quercetin dioxygenase-like cupin family protein
MVHDKKQIAIDKISATVTNLASLVNYQENSIVSRTIIDKETGTVTLFAFDEGQAMSEHTAPYDALVYIINGEGDIIISGKELRLQEGEMTIIPAKKPHAVKAAKRFKMLLIMVRSLV